MGKEYMKRIKRDFRAERRGLPHNEEGKKNVARALTLLVLVATADNQYGRSAPRFEEEKVVGGLRRYAPPRPLQPRIFK